MGGKVDERGTVRETEDWLGPEGIHRGTPYRTRGKTLDTILLDRKVTVSSRINNRNGIDLLWM